MLKLVEVSEVKLETWQSVISRTKGLIDSMFPDPGVLTIPLVSLKEFLEDINDLDEYVPTGELKEEKKKKPDFPVNAKKLEDLLDETAESSAGYDPKFYTQVRKAIKNGQITNP